MADGEETQQKSLTYRQRLFVDFYTGEANGNATRAATLAGFSEQNARSIGSRLLTNVNIQAAISARYAEAAMPPDEALSRLGEQARNEASRFFEVDGHGGLRLDVRALQEAGLMHLVKGVRETKYGQVIELYDAQAALIQIGRHHKLFTDPVSGEGGGPIVVKVLSGVKMTDL